MRALVLAIGLVIGLASAPVAAEPDPLALVEELGSGDRAVVERAVAVIEKSPSSPALADALFRAAMACEDTLADPARALALYERIVRDLPDWRSAGSAERKVAALRGRIGSGNEHARVAADFAQLIADADRLAPDVVEQRARVLATADWPGAPDVALWLAEWLRRTGRLDDAQAQYAEIATRWPGTKYQVLGIRGGAGNAIDARDWDLADRLSDQLPQLDDMDRIVRDDLMRLSRRGRLIDRWYLRAWWVAALAFMLLFASLAEVALRVGRPRWRPPIEVIYLAPIAIVLVGVALTTHSLIAPAVALLAGGGLALAWISGVALDTLRAHDRNVRRRALAHAAVCAVAVLALAVIALGRGNLLEMVIETVQFGPEP
jgi:hypothetical protein